jgi:large subunit ribosomal protein L5
VSPALQREFAYKNPMEIPRLQKITLNIGLGEARENPRAI